ncbi:hypothetical protein B0T20DRAFT_133166 [Sordaria brevicollis]|uniref:Uncharacterized protein n=1 Tax=Sordaria brevicollis TaxID=83679 RepID=A0AAE0PLF1_SORBR|nr:hypothetical protein B0T20DRAFT_133166 [Sordaria brevicollis]
MVDDSILDEWTWANLQLPVSALFVRFLQFGSSFYITNLLILLNEHVSEDAGTRLLQRLAAVTLSYHAEVTGFVALNFITKFVKKGSVVWRVLLSITVMGDLLVMGLAIALITQLSATGPPSACLDSYEGFTCGYYSEAVVDCRLLMISPVHDLVELCQTYIRIFMGTNAEQHATVPNFVCGLPNALHILAISTIFSHTFSLVLTALQVQRDSWTRASKVTKNE